MTLEPLWTLPDPDRSTPVPDGHHDVAVIGGGITGLTTALLLARAGQGVVLLEADRLGGGTTGRSTAKVSLLQGTRLGTLAGRHDHATLRAYVEAGAEGQAWLRRFCEDHDVPHDEQSAYTYATTAAGAELVRREHRQAAALGLPVRDERDPSLPFATTGCVALDGQVQVDPAALVGALAAETRRHGATLIEGARVVGLTGSGPYRVETTRGETTATSVVVATNYPLTDRAGHFAWFTPQRSYALALRGAAIGGMYLSAEQPSHSLRDAVVDGRQHLLVGGQGHVTGRTGSTAAHLELLRIWADEMFPEGLEVAAWSAQDYATADGLPWVGPLLPGHSRLLAAGGYDKWGFSTAVAAALALTADLLGGRLDWAAPLTSWRSRARGLASVGASGVRTGAELGLGWGRALTPPREPAEGEGHVARHGIAPVADSLVRGERQQVSAVCTHLRGVVRWNDAESSWDCPLHGSRFDSDGAVLEGPARCGLRRRGGESDAPAP